MMKSLFRGLMTALVLPACFQLHAAELDRVAAVVNDDVITASELRSRLAQVEHQLAGQGTPLPPASQLRQQVLERMVLERIQLERARQMNVTVDDASLDRAIQRIAEQNRVTLAEMPKLVEKEGMSWAQFRDSIRNEIIMVRLREREIEPRLSVSDAEIEAAMTAGNESPAGREYLISHIFLAARDGATPEQWMALGARADALMKQINAGEDFGKLAASYSSSQDAMQGGSLDWRPIERIPSVFADQLAGMKKGQVSRVLRTTSGLHVFKLVDQRDQAPKKVEIEQTHARHILIRTADVSNEAQARRRLEDLLGRIRNGADFQELARSNSSDITSTKGGDLGWVSPGDTVPEFEGAMNALKPGEVSGVVQTPFGWHLIQVVERRKLDVTADQSKMAARQAVRERKADEAYEDWLRQLRDTAYVEIKPE
ncbi:peptidylprolyl isomerase [Uliginosibacterium paludis]|uniref:Chaperone SurA n=1 Tax=Uliginosibacterium paludis TaxID=1615952 RepID=A0ABV2CRC3_9RHOO